jgi:phosphonatase-like hydrolase
MTLQLAVFDMVGTTVESGLEVPSAFREAFRHLGIELPDDAIVGIRGLSKRDAISALLSENRPTSPPSADQIERTYTRFQDALRSEYRARARPIPGAEDAVRTLRRAGVKVVLSTGLDRDTAAVLLTGLGWDALEHSGVVTGDDVERGRPAPDLIHAAMRLTGVESTKSVLVVGDTTADLEAAAAADAGWSVGVLSGAHPRERLEAFPHSALLESVEQLPRWLEEAGLLDPP